MVTTFLKNNGVSSLIPQLTFVIKDNVNIMKILSLLSNTPLENEGRRVAKSNYNAKNKTI